jgi:hypothetical protein
VYKKIEMAGEDRVLEFLGRQIAELQLIHRRMNGLHTYFQSEVPRGERYRIKEIKLQLTAIKNAIIKANQRKHDYVARKEEEEQMKRLGID